MPKRALTLASGPISIPSSMECGRTRETLRAMKAKGIWLVPTAATITYVGDTPEKIRNGPLKDLPPVSMEKVLKLGTQPRKLVKLAHQIGVGIALGTDAPLVPHGQNAAEMVEYVKAGMTPMEALMTGTVNAAAAGGIKNVGKLEPGWQQTSWPCRGARSRTSTRSWMLDS